MTSAPTPDDDLGRPDRAAFDRTAAVRATVDLRNVPPPSLDPIHAAAQARAIARRLVPFREAIAALPDTDVGHLDRLPDLVNALLFLQFTLVVRADRVRQLPALAAEAWPLRAVLLAYAEVLVLKGRVAAELPPRIRRGSGYLDLVKDLGTLAALFRELGDVTGPGAVVTVADVARASELSDAIGLGIVTDDDPDHDRASLLTERRKLLVLLLQSHDELRRAMTYLRHHQKDVARWVPSLYVPR